MVVELLLFVILFIISPIAAVILLATIAAITILYYTALLVISLASLIISSLPALALAAVILAAAYVAASALTVIAENVAAMMVGIGNFIGNTFLNASHLCTNVMQSVGNAFSAVASIFRTEPVAPVVAIPILREESSSYRSLGSSDRTHSNISAHHNHSSSRSQGVKFFNSATVSAPDNLGSVEPFMNQSNR